MRNFAEEPGEDRNVEQGLLGSLSLRECRRHARLSAVAWLGRPIRPLFILTSDTRECERHAEAMPLNFAAG